MAKKVTVKKPYKEEEVVASTRRQSVTTTRSSPAVFVYHDQDHGDMAAFDTLEKAIKHAKKQWRGAKIEPYNDEDDNTIWTNGEDGYIHIEKLEVK